MVTGARAPNAPGMKVSPGTQARLERGALITPRVLRSIEGASLAIPDAGVALVHLQFRRYAGCPICSLHLRQFARRHTELVQAGVREVAIFHSSEAELRQVHQLPFALVADPGKALYAEFGVGASLAAVLNPRVWPTALRAVVLGASADPMAGRESGSFGLPADFLIAGDGRLVAVKYGVHADDHWSVDELLRLARELGAPTQLGVSA